MGSTEKRHGFQAFFDTTAFWVFPYATAQSIDLGSHRQRPFPTSDITFAALEEWKYLQE